jgi:hypothetical protein
MNKMKNIVKLLLIVLLIAAQSCSEDFLDQFPSTQQSPESITSVSDARVVMNGAYELLQENSYYACNMITSNDARADDMQAIDNGRIEDEYLYNYTPDIDFDNTIWGHPYRVVRHVNSILSFIDDIEAEGTEITEKESIKGQALFIRALAHFDLCRMFGNAYSHDNGASLGVPIVAEVLSPDAKLERNTVAEVYAQVLADLNAAIPLLPDNDSYSRINVWAAKTLLARVYLYMENNAMAYSTAVDIIDNGPFSLIDRADYVDSWSEEGTSESILSIMNSVADNTGLSGIGNLSDPKGYGQFVASQDLMDLIASDPADIRVELLYIDSKSDHANPATWGRVLKYPGLGNTKAVIKDFWENGVALPVAATISSVPVLRLSEVYLIAAEAAVKDGDVANAEKYLNAIVERANPAATVATDGVNLDRILTERRKELMAEGHRFFDLIRNERDIVRSMSVRVFDPNGTPLFIGWQDYRILFPIPIDEINANPNITQNPEWKNN